MKSNKQLEPYQDEHDIEILKAVAQAWHGHSSSRRTTAEFDAHRLNFKNKPSRFKLEAMSKATSREYYGGTESWDFSQSLWDSYEIVNLSKKLEAGLALDHSFSGLDETTRIGQKRKESKNSLRSLFNRVSSRRYNEADLTPDNDGYLVNDG
ncbi:uncharacterized protein LOC107814103 [Nicotiana tabacum]|uniref:Uncharacterized protein LOC107814103 n=1 Tax=Nicotiana tabacum TaxID=4097 RepID=A0A1S4C198_TOBAC|nr:PREDICTED: uncharacterized protein LOC107814103 [Nicotiana tabacum]